MAHGLKHNEGIQKTVCGCLPSSGRRRAQRRRGARRRRRTSKPWRRRHVPESGRAELGAAWHSLSEMLRVRSQMQTLRSDMLSAMLPVTRARGIKYLARVVVTRCPPRRCGRLDAAEGRAFGTRRRCLARALSRASGRRGTGHRHSHPCWGAGAESTARRTARPT